MDLRSRIKQLNKRGISTKAIAERIEVSASVIYGFISGRPISTETETKLEESITHFERSLEK